jgi:hypothetical protein
MEVATSLDSDRVRLTQHMLNELISRQAAKVKITVRLLLLNSLVNEWGQEPMTSMTYLT